MSNFEYISCVRFLLQLFVCESIFMLNFKRRKFFLLRLAGSIGMCFFFGWLYIYLIRLIPDSSNHLRIPYYIMLFALSLLGMFISFDVKLPSVLFAGTGGYATQHIAYLISMLIRRYSGTLNEQEWFSNIMRSVPYLVVAALMYFLFVRKNSQNELVEKRSIRNILLALTAMLTTIVFSVLWTPVPEMQQNIHSISTIISCVLVIIIQNSFNKQNILEQENLLIERILSEKKEQQLVSKENIDVINYKFHDIKHQLNALKSIKNEGKRTSFIEEIEESMLVYDTIVETGNETLDIIINEKSLFCEKNNIKFTYLINGTKINFMKAVDIYALFSNALGNAIECELKESDEEKRIISLNCRTDENFTYVTIENYCSETPEFINGLPVTTKKDNSIHGYGTKSIRHIVKRYGGHVRMHVSKDMFVLEMLFRKRD